MRHVPDSIKLGTRAPSIPVLIVQAVHDELISSAEVSDELADAYSAGGTDVTYHHRREHLLLHPLSAPMTLRAGCVNDRRPARVRAPRANQVADHEPVDLPRDAALGLIQCEGSDGPWQRVGRRPLSSLDQ